MLKKIIFSALLVLCMCLIIVSCSDEKSLVGKWIDNETEAIFEYTEDGYYYEYANENFTTDKTRYTVKGGKIIYYLDGGNADEGFGVEYEFTDEGNLLIGGKIEYRPLTKPGEEQEK